MEKLENLRKYLTSLKSAAIAFSGGVDSSFLLKVAHDLLGDKVLAVTVRLHSFPEKDFHETEDFCKKYGIRQIIIDYNELDIAGFSKNPENRCYLCKKAIFTKIKEVAKQEGFLEVCEGSNLSDTGDYRPGMQAISELGIKTPLMHCGFYKEEIRLFSRDMGLACWNKPSAACLSSRFVYGEKITLKKLKMIEAGENLLHNMGFSQLRLRIHGEKLARIEILPDELEKVLSLREKIIQQLKQLGFTYVTLDLQGFRSGSMNEVLK
ncbi:hypothetical protein MSI_21110 [Treponema sp. JC4]|uniref:ATP-dependent sacrificial sulfur transferase LarE n=1 Tax=Treponema sp. JC4 TaxID=1124982 RepID=UPI00025B0AEF|nr:ATP-dependent sacrificial sulfur transferase LarE [Treponema sp. JC4]EID84416.1 hypothetical protein MSI_21110 [Treponema sp. JC4]